MDMLPLNVGIYRPLSEGNIDIWASGAILLAQPLGNIASRLHLQCCPNSFCNTLSFSNLQKVRAAKGEHADYITN